MKFTLAALEKLYIAYNRAEFVSPDPLETLYAYESVADREVVGLIASGLAYGRVNSILKSIERVLVPMKASPSQFVAQTSAKDLRRIYRGFVHRFTSEAELVHFLLGIQDVLRQYQTIENCFVHGAVNGGFSAGMDHLAGELLRHSAEGQNSLLPIPARGSACKRLNLFLRWMVRSDNVDPGGWTLVSPANLIVPLDTHMYRVALEHGLTSRKSADMKTASEITKAFAHFAPTDPVRYDFALTRAGIRANNANAK